MSVFESSKGKIIHLEAIRILAILCVIYIHSGYRGHEAYTCTDSRVTFIVSLILACITNIGVDLFWMVSGAVLLRKKEDAATVYTKRIPRIIIVLLIFSVLRYFYDYYMMTYGSMVYWSEAYGINAGAGGAEIGIGDFITRFISGRIFLPYWFLYFYIGILLVLPFISKMTRNMNLTDWKYLAAVELVLVFIGIMKVLTGVELAVPIFIPDSVCAFVFGYMAESVIPGDWISKGRNIVGIFGASVIMIAFEVAITLTLGDPSGDSGIVYTSILGQIIAFNVLLIARGISLKINRSPKRIASIICYVGGCTFGLYLIEDYIRQMLTFIYDKLSPVMTVMPACIVWVICSFVVGTMVVGIIKKLPGIGKLI